MSSIATWLASLSLKIGSTNANVDSEGLAHWQEVKESYLGRPTTSLLVPHSKSPPTSGRHRSPSIYSEVGSTSSSINSEYRSTWELLRALPSRATAAQVRTTLPTHFFSVLDLMSQLPDGVEVPLAPSLFKSVSTTIIEREIVRILDLRERLRVEEIFLEMQIDMEQLYVSPPVYHAASELLGNVRILIIRACQSLAYIQSECTARGLALNIAHIDNRRVINRPRNHPFYTLSRYLRPSAWEDFNNFKHFEQQARVGDEVGHRAWDEILAVGEFVETGASESSDESMQHDYHEHHDHEDDHKDDDHEYDDHQHDDHQHDDYWLVFGSGRYGLPPATKPDLPGNLVWSAGDDGDD